MEGAPRAGAPTDALIPLVTRTTPLPRALAPLAVAALLALGDALVAAQGLAPLPAVACDQLASADPVATGAIALGHPREEDRFLAGLRRLGLPREAARS